MCQNCFNCYTLFKHKMSLKTNKVSTNCDLCSKEMHLIWSKLGIPYIIHTNSTTCRDIFPHTPEMAIVVKNLLYSHLQQGGGIVIRSFCDQCCDRADTNISDRKDIYVKDYIFIDNKGSKCTFDIAYLYKDGTFKQGYHLWTQGMQDLNTHLTWYKLHTNNVLAALDKNSNFAVINNYFTTPTCNKVYCKPMFEMASLMGYRLPDSYYKDEINKIIDEASLGFYYEEPDDWNVSGNQAKNIITKKIWKSFLLQEKCIKCEKQCHTLYKQPFCQTCLAEVSTIQCGYYPPMKILISKERRKYLQSRLDWLNKIPKYTDNKCIYCCLCGGNINLLFHDCKQPVFWKGKCNVNCCVECVKIYFTNNTIPLLL